MSQQEPLNADQEVAILYTNYRGERLWRRIRPLSIWFGVTEWHPECQWLLDAVDLDRNVKRSFALQDIEAWRNDADSSAHERVSSKSLSWGEEVKMS